MPPAITKRRSSLETPPGLLRLRKALTSRFVSKTALIMLLPVAACAPDGMDLFDNFFFGQRSLSAAETYLVDDPKDTIASLPTRLRRGARHREATLEHVRLQLFAVMHVEFLPDFVRERNSQLAVADVRFRHRLLHRVHMAAAYHRPGKPP